MLAKKKHFNYGQFLKNKNVLFFLNPSKISFIYYKI
tara:strand:+ start:86 stop:193 length:108 start_codon:yes stop_codon:yes gene_type:complete